MNKALRITLISIASLVALVAAGAGVVCYLLFTPDRLTPIVRSQAPRYVTCDVEVDEVELTFFSTFPNLGLRASGLTLINPMEGAPSDTLLRLRALDAIIDARAFLLHDQVDVSRFELHEGRACLYEATDGTANYDILRPDPDDPTDDDPLQLGEINLHGIVVDRVAVTYASAPLGLRADLEGIELSLEGERIFPDIRGRLTGSLRAAAIDYSDSSQQARLYGLAVPDYDIDLHTPADIHAKVASSFDSLRYSQQGAAGADTMRAYVRRSWAEAEGRIHLDGETFALDSLSATTRSAIDSLSYEQLGPDPLTATIAHADLPRMQARIARGIALDMETTLGALTAYQRSTGTLAQRLPLGFKTRVEADTALTCIRIADCALTAARERLTLEAEVRLPDSTTVEADVELHAASTTFDRLLALVPPYYKASLDGATVHGTLTGLSVKASAALVDTVTDIRSFDVRTRLTDLSYDAPAVTHREGDVTLYDSPATQAQLQAFDFTARYPVESPKMARLKRQLQVGRQQVAQVRRRSKAASEAQFMQVTLDGRSLHVVMDDTSHIEATIPQMRLTGTLSDELLHDDGATPFASADFAFSHLDATLDTLTVSSDNMNGQVAMADGVKNMKTYYEATFACNNIDAAMGQALHAVSGPLAVEASSVYDEHQTDMLLMYNPVLNMTLLEGKVDMEGIPYTIGIPALDFDFNLGKFTIRGGDITLGGSDFHITGDVENVGQYLREEGLLTADLALNSHQTDVYQLMDIVNGLNVVETEDEDSDPAATGSEDGQGEQNNQGEMSNLNNLSDQNTLNNPSTQNNLSTPTDQPADDAVVLASDIPSAAEVEAANPFMVPKGVYVKLATHIDQALCGDNVFSRVGGKVTIDDGILVLEEMGFSSKAARMQMTAMYTSPRKNHLSVGLDFHLLDIEIADLIRMVPEIDTIMPMLSSLEGQAEFHIAAETNLFATYQPKMSSLKATAAIEGKNLVLLDGETFDQISRYLMFKKKTRNVVDTLSVEMAVARKKATIYPMLIGIDKYQAVISGFHNLTGAMGFNYHISVTDAPIVGGLIGLDITGDMERPEDFTFKVGKCKYANLYKPEKRNVTQEQTLELKRLISTSLKQTVRPQEPEETPAE